MAQVRRAVRLLGMVGSFDPDKETILVNETLFEKFIRVLMESVRARALLKEIVHVCGSPANSAEASAEREAALVRLCQQAKEELSAPPIFARMPRRRWGVVGFVERLRLHQ